LHIKVPFHWLKEMVVQLPDCSTVRGGHEMVTVGSDVYALGGWDNTDFLEVVDIFDTRAGAWRQGKDMKTKHAYFSAAHLDGDLYAMSGMSDRKASPPFVSCALNPFGLTIRLRVDGSGQTLLNRQQNCSQGGKCPR
jgi:hypothetical protein